MTLTLALSELSGLVQTVLGPVRPEELGPTMTHEHLLINFLCMFTPPEEASELGRVYEPITIENLGRVRQDYYSYRDNLLLTDEDTAIAEAALYARHGGGAIVDATTIGIGRDPLALARIARATGLHIIMGAGYYVDAVHPAEMYHRSEYDIARSIVEDVKEGVGDTGIRAGIIGEIGCTWPLTSNERKVLRAAAAAQLVTGAPILIHPGRSEQAPFEILDVLTMAGANLSRVIMGHLDRTIFDPEALMDLAAADCYLEWDLFGIETSYYPLSDIVMPNDIQRLDAIKRLIDEGYGHKIVIAHDICTKHRLTKYGGHGYHYILERVVPQMRRRGFSEQDIHAILVDNPASVLAFV